MVKIKFCGLSRKEDIQAVNQLLPDYIGFVFAPSKRQVTPLQAAAFKAALSSEIKSSGVFVNADLELVTELCDQGVLDLVQLHGNETEEYIQELQKLITQPIIKAVRVQNTAAILQADNTLADYLLLDTYHSRQYGGVGQTFDWQLIPPLKKPFFLAGGLQAGNIKEALNSCQPYALDLSSGIETAGLKDKAKMAAIMKILGRN